MLCVWFRRGAYKCLVGVSLVVFWCFPSPAWMGGDCLVVGGFGCWEDIAICVFVPCGVDDLGLFCCIFRQFLACMGCWEC